MTATNFVAAMFLGLHSQLFQVTQPVEAVMFSRISWGKIQEGKWDEFEAAFKEAVTKAGDQKGLKGRMLFRDKVDPNAGFTLSIWETEQDMKNYENSDTMKKLVLPEIEPFFIGDYKTTFAELRYSETDI